MEDILLRELSNADIDWLVRAGERQPLATSDVLLRPAQVTDCLYLLLEGHLSVRSSGDREISRLSRGEWIAEEWLFDTESIVSVVATEPALVLAIPKRDLLEKLQKDVSFSAHFYRVLALSLSDRIHRLFEHANLLRYQSGQVVKETLFVFGELHDSDIDWMMAAGQIEKLAAEKVLLHMGRPVDALYTLLDGQLVISTTDHPCDPLSACSHGLEELGTSQTFIPLAYLSRGGLPGITAFLDFQPLPVRIHALRDSLLLTIPRQQVSIKLQEDPGFAARFYRVMATQMASLLSAVISVSSKMGDSKMGDSKTIGSEMNQSALTAELEGELDLAALQEVSEGAAKFDWMLKQFGVGYR